MTLRKLHSVTLGPREARVYRDAAYDEYRVRFYVDGKLEKNSDYFTSSKDDAFDTASYWTYNQATSNSNQATSNSN